MTAHEPQRPVVPPPVPAPYLKGIEPLSPAALRASLKPRPTPAERRLLRREQTDREQRIIAARLAYQDEHGVEIRPEPFAGPDEIASKDLPYVR